MKRRTSTLTAAMVGGLATLLLLGGTSLLAQEPPPEVTPPSVTPDLDSSDTDQGDLNQRREQLQERLRILRAWRLTEVIELDETTGAQLFNLLDLYDEQIEVEQTRLAELSGQLRTYLEQGSGDEQEVGTLVDDIMSVHLRIEQIRVSVVQDSADFLNARQRAALMLFLPEFEQEVRQMVREVRGRRQGQRRHQRDQVDERGPQRRRGPRGSGLAPRGPRMVSPE